MSRVRVCEAAEIVTFWQEAGPEKWFAKDGEFDARFLERCLTSHEAASRGELEGWLDRAPYALALILLLDQFPRNAFRSTPRMFATDAMAREKADRALELAYDRDVEPQLQVFFYLPFEHSEDLIDQDRSVQLCERLGGELAKFAVLHRDIVRRFGHFPHRNAVLDRPSTEAEQAFLAGGGFSG